MPNSNSAPRRARDKTKTSCDVSELTGTRRRDKATSANPANPASSPSPELPEELLESLSRLDTVELYSALRTVEALVSARQKKSNISVSEPLWYYAIETKLATVGAPCVPFHVIPNHKLGPAWRRGVAALQSYADTMQAQTPAEAARGRTVLVEVLFEWMRKCRVPMSFKAFVQNMDNIGPAVESSFPGYRRSGLLRFLLRSI